MVTLEKVETEETPEMPDNSPEAAEIKEDSETAKIEYDDKEIGKDTEKEIEKEIENPHLKRGDGHGRTLLRRPLPKKEGAHLCLPKNFQR